MTTRLQPPARWWRARALHEAMMNVLAAAERWGRAFDGQEFTLREYQESAFALARAVRRFRDLELPDEQGGDDGCRGR
jgi:hypothetical protein